MAKKKEIESLPKLSAFESNFINVYFTLGFNGNKAYKMLRPEVSDATSRSESSKLLAKPHIQHAIEVENLRIKNEQDIDLGFLVKALKGVVYDVQQEFTERDANGRITTKPDRANLIKAVDTLAKLGGLYTQKVDMTTQGEKINTVINIGFFDDDDKEDNVEEDGTQIQ